MCKLRYRGCLVVFLCAVLVRNPLELYSQVPESRDPGPFLPYKVDLSGQPTQHLYVNTIKITNERRNIVCDTYPSIYI
jgi:hypothetical protein